MDNPPFLPRELAFYCSFDIIAHKEITIKILFCKNCSDAKMLLPHRLRYCYCRLSYGRYLKNGKARYGGPSLLLGIDSKDIQILHGPFVDTPEYVIHKAYAISPTASTVEYMG